ncbi:cell division protein FtsA [Treponema sp. OMZ 840]|uniref:cell division protein FtsA n=1 Tax=Treponema sp. OMZ 840 TaxID=244313 RepID=UPI003D907533
MSDIIVGLDIGTSNLRAVIGEYSEDGSLLITGVGTAPSTGLRAGLIVNIESTMTSIKAAFEAAEMMAGREVQSCITAVGGSQIESLTSKGLVAVTAKSKSSREINGEDIERVLEASRAVNIPLDRHILHVIPRSYIVDGQGGIKDPLNMLGVRLESEVCIITSSRTSTENLLRCVSRAGYTVDNVMLKTLASAQAVVSEEEKELGSIVIDLGGGTTDVLVLAEGSPLCAVSIPVGGNLVSNDIALVRGISLDTAEKLKKTSGCCWEGLVSEDDEVIIPGIGGNPPQVLSRLDICKIIQPRIEEIFAMVRQKLPEQVKKQRLSGSVVLAGGGALMSGIAELAAKEFKTENIRIAQPGNYGGPVEIYRSPEFATVTGLLVSNTIAMKEKKADASIRQGTHRSHSTQGSVLRVIGEWFREFF